MHKDLDFKFDIKIFNKTNGRGIEPNCLHIAAGNKIKFNLKDYDHQSEVRMHCKYFP